MTPERARELCAAVPDRVTRVAVLRHPPAALWRRVLEVFEPDWLQSDADDFGSDELDAALAEACAKLPVYRSAAGLPSQPPPRLLFEGAVSGSGTPADWAAAAELAPRTQLILAGGLDASNVGDAIRRVRPWGVDVSSGVERRRGEKDPKKIREFVARARAVEEEK